MNDKLEQTGLDAVDRFIDTWNSRDAEKWADSLNFPHVRPSPFGPIEVAGDSEEYVSRVDFSRVVETGWDHSEWDYKHVIHTSPTKIHVAGQWSRYTEGGEVILTTPIVYIVTLVDGKWGIQSRFGSDYAGDDDTTGMETRAINLIEDFINNANNRNTKACAELLNYPHYNIGVGDLIGTTSAAEFTLPHGRIDIESLIALQTGKRSLNAAMDITVTAASGPHTTTTPHPLPKNTPPPP
ncbi:MAG: hypothetical protein HUJ31_05790, partial [Pseudomonadales bacterium]|nr:hypothetical protein [Pseudomonadales bacterium]